MEGQQQEVKKLLRREEIRTMQKDIVRLRESAVQTERERIVTLKLDRGEQKREAVARPKPEQVKEVIAETPEVPLPPEPKEVLEPEKLELQEIKEVKLPEVPLPPRPELIPETKVSPAYEMPQRGEAAEMVEIPAIKREPPELLDITEEVIAPPAPIVVPKPEPVAEIKPEKVEIPELPRAVIPKPLKVEPIAAPLPPPPVIPKVEIPKPEPVQPIVEIPKPEPVAPPVKPEPVEPMPSPAPTMPQKPPEPSYQPPKPAVEMPKPEYRPQEPIKEYYQPQPRGEYEFTEPKTEYKPPEPIYKPEPIILPKPEFEEKTPQPFTVEQDSVIGEVVYPHVPRRPSGSQKFTVRILTIVLAILFYILIYRLLTFFYWYFYVSEGIPITPPQKEEPVSQEPVIPSALIAANYTETLEVSGQEQIALVLSTLMKKTFESDGFIRVLIKNTSENRYLGINEFFQAFDIKTPEGLLTKLDNDFNLFIYTSKKINRLGFVAKVSNNEGLESSMKYWETSMEKDTTTLFKSLGKTVPASSSKFKASTQKAVIFRYISFPQGNFGICWSTFDNYLLWTTSGESMLKTINALKP